MNELPIACTLTPDDLRNRRADLLAWLSERAAAREVLESGMQLQLDASAETLARLLRLIDVERQCCRFLQFELIFAANLGPLTLKITGPAGTREFLQALLDRQNP